MGQNVEESPTLIKQFTRRTAPRYVGLRMFGTANGKVEMSKSWFAGSCKVLGKIGRKGHTYVREIEQIEKAVKLVGRNRHGLKKRRLDSRLFKFFRRGRCGSRQTLAGQWVYLFTASKVGCSEAAWHHNLERDVQAQETEGTGESFLLCSKSMKFWGKSCEWYYKMCWVELNTRACLPTSVHDQWSRKQANINKNYMI